MSTQGYIDRATQIKSVFSIHNGNKHTLVMSDEFNEDGRSFAAGRDLLFEALDKPDNSNEAMQYYSSDYVTTRNGSAIISTKAVKTSWYELEGEGIVQKTKNYTSGGILEMSIKLPGKSDSGGLWPAAWLMGNLARATYEDTTLNIWPWSYSTCGAIDSLSTKQLFNACEKHPGYGMNPHQGRGAPEIDIFEVMAGHNMPGQTTLTQPIMSASLQVSPGIAAGRRRPINGHKLNSSQLWYQGLRMGPDADYNYYFWGQQCGIIVDETPDQIHKYTEDAISVNSVLKDTHFERQHLYRLEWQPGRHGYLEWYLDNKLIFAINGENVFNLTGALIPEEPMYLILNTAVSHRWGMPEPCDVAACPVCWICYDCTNPDCQCTLPDGMKNCKNLPAEMTIDYIRLYQDTSDPMHALGCSTAAFPSAEYIDSNPGLFQNWSPFMPVSATLTAGSQLLLLTCVLALSAAVTWLMVNLRHRYRHKGGVAYVAISDVHMKEVHLVGKPLAVVEA